MQKEINLLPKRQMGFFQEERTIMMARAVTILSALLVVSSFVGVFFLGRNYSIQNVEAQQNQVRAQLRTMQGKITMDMLLVDRIKHIQKILGTRILLGQRVATIQKQLPKDVTLESITITNTSIVLSASSTSLSSLKSFLDNLTAMTEKKVLFKKLTINNIVVNAKTGVYLVNVQGITL